MRTEESLQEEIEQLGYEAFLAGADITECPFPADSTVAELWQKGWNEAFDGDYILWNWLM